MIGAGGGPDNSFVAAETPGMTVRNETAAQTVDRKMKHISFASVASGNHATARSNRQAESEITAWKTYWKNRPGGVVFSGLK
jgi:hypothetical protein